MITLLQACQDLTEQLCANHIDEAEFKALCLACGALGIPNNAYRFHLHDAVDETVVAEYTRRASSGEPIQYILGKWDFYESEFAVGKGVLIPRPETEELVTLALQCAAGIQPRIIVDLCAGSGCIGVSLAKKLPGCTVYCIEKSTAALTYLKRNAEGIPNVIVVQADIAEPIDLPPADIIISNPPYIKSALLPTLQSEVRFEPDMALDGGDDGLMFYRIINELWYPKLKQDGVLLLEIGDDQADAMKEVLNHFTEVTVYRDMYGKHRMVKAK